MILLNLGNELVFLVAMLIAYDGKEWPWLI